MDAINEEKLAAIVMERFAVVNHELTKRLKSEELEELLQMYNNELQGRYFTKKGGFMYYIKGTHITNYDHKAYVSINYVPVLKVNTDSGSVLVKNHEIKFGRPAHEFLVGRYTFEKELKEN